MSDKTPFEKGYDDGFALKPAPAFPTPDSSWAERLYARGWSSGVDACLKSQTPQKKEVT